MLRLLSMLAVVSANYTITITLPTTSIDVPTFMPTVPPSYEVAPIYSEMSTTNAIRGYSIVVNIVVKDSFQGLGIAHNDSNIFKSVSIQIRYEERVLYITLVVLVI